MRNCDQGPLTVTEYIVATRFTPGRLTVHTNFNGQDSPSDRNPPQGQLRHTMLSSKMRSSVGATSRSALCKPLLPSRLVKTAVVSPIRVRNAYCIYIH